MRVQVPSAEDAYIAFEVLNSRSTPVSAHELVRSFLLTKGGNLAHEVWQHVESLATKISDVSGAKVEVQERFTCELLEYAWLLTFGKYLTLQFGSGSSGVAQVRRLFARAREDLQGSDAVARVCSTLKDIAPSAYELISPSSYKSDLRRHEQEALESLVATGFFSPSGRAVLIALKARMPAISKEVAHRIAAIAVRARVLKTNALKLNRELETAAKQFFDCVGESEQVADRVLRYPWSEMLGDDEQFRRSFEDFHTDNMNLVAYLLVAIERKLGSDRVLPQVQAVRRFRVEGIEQAMAELLSGQSRFKTRYEMKAEVDRRHQWLGNWILEPLRSTFGDFKTHHEIRRDGLSSQSVMDTIARRQKWLAEQAMALWTIHPPSVDLSLLNYGPRRHPNTF